MSENVNIFDSEPDPRIKWALNILGNDGVEPSPIYSHYFYPTINGAVMFIGRILRNRYLRRPVYAGAPMTAFMVAAATYGGFLIRDYSIKRKTEEMAILEHYIRLHPERFPEPETKKYGDKCVFYEWRRLR